MAGPDAEDWVTDLHRMFDAGAAEAWSDGQGRFRIVICIDDTAASKVAVDSRRKARGGKA